MPEPLPEFLFNGPANAATTIALAHGAGAPMDSPFMDTFATALGKRGFRVARFEFPYMAARRNSDRRPPPNRAPVLIETWQAVIDHLAGGTLIIGGKSMGGRIASMIAAELEKTNHGTRRAPVKGVICLGYPFHPPGKPDRLRTEHLAALTTPTLILQGTRDTLGTRAEVAGYSLSGAIRIEWLEDGDHGFKPRKKSGRTEAQNFQQALGAIDDFAATL